MPNQEDNSSLVHQDMADIVQIPFTSAGYSSGSDDGNDDTDSATTLSLKQDNTITLNKGIVKQQQQMYLYSEEYDKWHECDLILTPPQLQINAYTDTQLEIHETQLQHIHKRWFHGNISRREAKYILQDYSGGEGSFLVRTSESYSGKFAISFMHEERVKHVVIETKPDSLTGVVYHITPKGPFFHSLNGLIEEAKHSCIIQNHSLDVILTKSPPKPDHSWLQTHIKSLSQAELLMMKDIYSKDGSFIVYPTHIPLSPYSIVYRSNGNIIHTNIMTSQRTAHGLLTLNGTSSPVLYKLIHYFMENPINSSTVLNICSSDICTVSNSAISIEDFAGDWTKNELSFHNRDLITNISRRSHEWCVGDHHGDKQKFFPTKYVRFLTEDELQYIRDVRVFYQKSRPLHYIHSKSYTLNLRTDYMVTFETDGLSHIINITPRNSFVHQTYKLSCNGYHDVEKWYEELGSNKQANNNMKTVFTSRKSNIRKKRASCVIS